jgi:threonine/homoserine/homoserine lactone efflux protein
VIRALGLGLLVGFPIAATPGPMFFLVLRRTLAQGWRSGLPSGMGIATADGIYATVAALGMSALINLLVAQRRWIGLVGGIAIVAIGIRSLVVNPVPGRPPQPREGVSAYMSTLGLTLANPPTILSFLAVFAGLGVRVGAGWAPAAALVVGVTLGSACWWLLFAGLVAFLRRRVSSSLARGISIASGLALIAFGSLITLQSL